MAPYIIAIFILGYTGFIIYKKVKAVKEGKSCCSGCSSCPSRRNCGKDLHE